MKSFNLNITLISFHLLLISLFICSLTASFAQPTQDPVCEGKDCGQGTCKASNATSVGFECECNPGWKLIQLLPLISPSCVVPDCTLNFQCGNGDPSPPSPPTPPFVFPPSPCFLVWCGEGTCVTNGTGYTCQCYEGSDNLFNNKNWACFEECSFGADCNKVGLGHPMPPPPSSSTALGKGSNEAPNWSRNLHALTVILLSAIFLTWV